MSNSFKKVIACILAVLMVTFSVPFSALAAGYDNEPDIRIQFNALNENAGDPESWVSNISEGSIDQKGKNTAADFSQAGLSSPQLAVNGALDSNFKYTIKGLTLEAQDVDNYLAARGEDEEFETEKASLVPEDVDRTAPDFNIDDYNYGLQAGDTFTVTVRMDNVSTLYVATNEIAYSNNIEPVYVVENGKMSSSTRTVKFGTATQVGEDPSAAAPLADYDAQALYEKINEEEIGSTIKADYDGQMYMYSEVIGDGTDEGGTDWATVNDPDAPVLTKEDGTIGNTYQNKSVMATYMFVLKSTPSADNPIQFWVHNGNTEGHSKDDDTGEDGFSSFNEGMYEATSDDNLATCATYALNKFAGALKPFGADEPNPGSYKMSYMGKNENVSSPECPHTNTTTTQEKLVPAGCTTAGSYEEVVTCNDCGVELSRTPKTIPATGHDYVAGTVVAPTCTEQGYTPYTCSKCGDTYNGDFVDAKGHAWGAWTVTTPEVPAECGKAGTTAIETSVCGNDNTHTQTRGGEEIPALTHNYIPTVTEPTCTEQGYTTYVCEHCGDTYTGDFTDAKGHAYAISSIDWDTLNTETGAVTANYVCANDATHETTGSVQTTSQVIQQQTEEDPEITRFTYDDGTFSDYKDVQTKNPSGHTTHNYTVPVSIAWDGADATTATVTLKCNKCEATTTTAAAVDNVKKSDATCTEAAVYTYTASYDGLDSISKDVTVGSPLGHTLSKTDEVPASCTEAGTKAYWTCSTCHNMFADADAQTKIDEPEAIPAKGHTPRAAVKENEVAPTKTTDGSYDLVVRCDVCETVLSTEHVVVPAEGMTITITKHDIGEVTVNGKVVDGLDDTAVNVPYNSEVKLNVTEANEYFKGWEANGKIVSKDAAYTTYAYTDMTFTPVFEEPSSQKISVIFYDKFGNEVKAYKDMTPADYQAAIATDGIPKGQDYPSSKFVEWDTDANTILGLTTSKTIWAVYEDVESTQKYTVTVKDAAGADITDTALTLPAGVQATAVPYDTKATVQNDNAKGWKIDGVVVSTEDTYSFFVGADTEVTMITDDVEALPTTTIIGATRLADPAYRFNIMATRYVPAGYSLVDYGFVYGKNLTDADLKVENEGKQGNGINSGAVKVVRAGQMNSSSNEFALNYGIKAMDADVTVKSFIVVKKGDVVQTVYSDYTVFNY